MDGNRFIEELECELNRLQKRDRRKVLIAGALTALIVAVSTIVYISKGAGFYQTGYFPVAGSYGQQNLTGETASYTGFPGSGWPAGTAGGVPAEAAGGCCDSGSSSGGCSIESGQALSGGGFKPLENQALSLYVKETGDSSVKALARDFGCHIQIDILDASGKVIRSYGYQGGPLYVIK